jgi:hypothetical protein
LGRAQVFKPGSFKALAFELRQQCTLIFQELEKSEPETEPVKRVPRGQSAISRTFRPAACSCLLTDGMSFVLTCVFLSLGVEESEAEDCIRKGAAPGRTGPLTEVPCLACNALA